MTKRRPVIKIIPAERRHVGAIAWRLRQADREEVFAASGQSPLDALMHSFEKSSLCMTATVNGVPEVMFGAGDINILNGIAAPWLLGTDAVETHYVRFLRSSVEWRAKLLERYSILRNFVDDRNTVSIRWLEWLGFRLLEPVQMNGHAFRLFELRSADVQPNDGSNRRLNAVGCGRTSTASASDIGGEQLQRQGRGNERDHFREAREGCA